MHDVEVIQSLETIRGRVKEQLQNVKEYRAFLAIQDAIGEISEITEIVTSLEGVRDRVKDRLNDVREYRALLAVEKSIADISEVLGILAEVPTTGVASPETQTEIRAEAALAEVATAMANGQSASSSHWNSSGVAHEPAPIAQDAHSPALEPAPDREWQIAASDISDVLGILAEAVPTTGVASPETQTEIHVEAALAEVATAMANGQSASSSHWNSSGVAHEPAPIAQDAHSPALEPAPDMERQIAASASGDSPVGSEVAQDGKSPDPDVPVWRVA